MPTEKRILYLLRDGRGLNENTISDILAVTTGEGKKKTRELIKELTKGKILKKEENLIKIASRGKRKLLRDNIKIQYKGSYFKRSWTMIVFDIPESQKKIRDTLRYHIKKDGFSLMQGSLWVNPNEPSEKILKFIRNKNLRWHVKVLKFSMDKNEESEMVHRIWKLDKLNASYEEFIGDAKRYFKLVKEYKFDSEILRLKALDLLARETEDRYLAIVKDDPRLPKSLLPRDFLGNRAHKIYKQLDKYLIKN